MVRDYLDVTENFDVFGKFCGKAFDCVDVNAASLTLTSAHYGKLLLLRYAGSLAITLPANGAPVGTEIYFLVTGANTCAPTWSAVSANTLITFNNRTTCDSVTLGSGQRIGAFAKIVSNGTYWVFVLMSAPHALTVTTS